jgi:hypothetical protein
MAATTKKNKLGRKEREREREQERKIVGEKEERRQMILRKRAARYC